MFKGCIYKITCKKNGKLYIGQTIRTPEIRMYHHLRDAKVKNQNSSFYRAIRKYGDNCFYVELIEEVVATNKQELKIALDELEKKYIKEYNTYLKGYNSTLGGDGTLGFKLSDEHKKKIHPGKGWVHSDETKKKISEKHKGKKVSDETKAKLREARNNQIFDDDYFRNLKDSMKRFRKKVAQYDFEGNLLKVYDSITIASEETGMSNSAISAVCNDKRQSAGGYYWRIAEGEVEKTVNTNVNVEIIKQSQPKEVIQFRKDGSEIGSYPSIREASKATGVVLSSIIENCKGKRKSAGGFIWEYRTETGESVG